MESYNVLFKRNEGKRLCKDGQNILGIVKIDDDIQVSIGIGQILDKGQNKEAIKGYLENILCFSVNVHKPLLKALVLHDGKGEKINIADIEIEVFNINIDIKVDNKGEKGEVHNTKDRIAKGVEIYF